MGIKNSAGNYLVVVAENNGHVTVNVFSSEAAKDANAVAPTEENTPDRLGLFIGTAFEEAKIGVTNLDGKNLADKEADLLLEVIVAQLSANYKLLPRTKFESSDWVKTL